MAGIKIVDLPAVGRDLAATDLFEMSLVGGTGSRKITGQEIMNASKLSVNNTPVINGTSGRIFFQDAANVLQQSANLFWDSLNNTLNILGNASLNNIFAEGNIIVDTANVWLSNGYAIGEYSTGNNRIEFYTTKLSLITNGNDVMTLFNSGNVAIGTTTDAGFKLDVNGSARMTTSLSVGTLGIDGYVYLNRASTGTNVGGIRAQGGGSEIGGGGFLDRIMCTNGAGINFFTYTGSGSGSTQKMQIFASSGNVLIQNGGTFTDNGYRLDVNGTARVVGNTLLDSGIIATSTATTRLQGSLNYFTHNRIASSGVFGFQISSYGTLASFWRWDSVTYDTEIGGAGAPLSGGLKFFTAGTEKTRITAGGNILINTTTDAGFRLDVNGTARVSGRITAGDASTAGDIRSNPSVALNFGGGQTTNTFTFRQINSGAFSPSGLDQSLINLAINQAESTANPNRGSIIAMSGTINNTGGTGNVYRGIYYNPTLVSLTNTQHFAWHSTSGRFKIEGLPTSPTGLTAGELWNNGGVINIV
jgi:hypothetical protein